MTLTATQRATVDLAHRVGLDLSPLPSDGVRRVLPGLRWYRTAVATRDAYIAALPESPSEKKAALAVLRGLVDALRAAADEVRAKSVAPRTDVLGVAPPEPFELAGSGWSALVEATSTGLDNFLDVLSVEIGT